MGGWVSIVYLLCMLDLLRIQNMSHSMAYFNFVASLYENIPFCVHLQKPAISKQIEIYTHCSLCLCLSVCITLQYCHHWSSIECIELSIKLFIRLMKSHFNWHWTFAIRPIAQNWDVPNRNPEEDDWRAKRDENSIFELCLWWNSRHLIVNQFL